MNKTRIALTVEWDYQKRGEDDDDTAFVLESAGDLLDYCAAQIASNAQYEKMPLKIIDAAAGEYGEPQAPWAFIEDALEARFNENEGISTAKNEACFGAFLSHIYRRGIKEGETARGLVDNYMANADIRTAVEHEAGEKEGLLHTVDKGREYYIYSYGIDG